MHCGPLFRTFLFRLPVRALLALAVSSPVMNMALSAPSSPVGCISNAIVTRNANDGTGTLRSAVAGLCSGGTIRFAGRIVITLASEIVVDKRVTIDGSSVAQDASFGDAALVRIRGGAGVRSFRVNAGGDLTLRSVRISDGAPADLGGGVRNIGRLAVLDARFDHNTAGTSNGLGGGAIFNAFGGVLVVDGSVFDANDAQRGSAIFNSGTAQIGNSTFSGNGLVLQREGAIQNRGTLVAVHVTIAHNGNNGGFGGLFAFGADTTLINSIFALNSGTECGISGGKVTSIALLATGNQCQPALSDNPQLAPLAANGGSTMTHALVEGSPALNLADPIYCPPTDQRGVERPESLGCDLGAFELEGADVVFADGFDAVAPRHTSR
jgi:hypothetical protein